MFEELKNRNAKRIGEDTEKVSAVLVPLIKIDQEYHILFEVRSGKLRQQPGEICFPGGRKELNESTKETAIRETCEELLLTPEQIKIFGPLDYYISNGKMRVEAFLGEINNYQNSFSSDEVESVFTVPLSFFKENEAQIYYNTMQVIPAEDFPHQDVPGGKFYSWRGGSFDVPFYYYKDYVIWGLTARLLYHNLKYLF